MQFFHYLNSRHINIRFTMEKESENRLPFLDVLIDNNQVPVLTTVFCKSTFTGLLMNFTSFTSYSYKLGLIRTLIDRSYKINSTWLGFHQETTKIKDFLLKNSYPAHIIDKAINSTINKFFQFNRQNGNNSPECSYVKLPYVGKFSAILWFQKISIPPPLNGWFFSFYPPNPWNFPSRGLFVDPPTPPGISIVLEEVIF